MIKEKKMTEAEFDSKFDEGMLDEEYAEYIMEHGDRPIGNGDMLICAMEDMYMADSFKDYMVGK